jgi:hypothetical protein
MAGSRKGKPNKERHVPQLLKEMRWVATHKVETDRTEGQKVQRAELERSPGVFHKRMQELEKLVLMKGSPRGAPAATVPSATPTGVSGTDKADMPEPHPKDVGIGDMVSGLIAEFGGQYSQPG